MTDRPRPNTQAKYQDPDAEKPGDGEALGAYPPEILQAVQALQVRIYIENSVEKV